MPDHFQTRFCDLWNFRGVCKDLGVGAGRGAWRQTGVEELRELILGLYLKERMLYLFSSWNICKYSLKNSCAAKITVQNHITLVSLRDEKNDFFCTPWF
jgi:hypothetical protein